MTLKKQLHTLEKRNAEIENELHNIEHELCELRNIERELCNWREAHRLALQESGGFAKKYYRELILSIFYLGCVLAVSTLVLIGFELPDIFLKAARCTLLFILALNIYRLLFIKPI